MSRYTLITTAIMALVFAAAGANSAAALNQLEDINVQKTGDSIVVIITTSEPCEFNSFLTSDKPERIVVDLAGVDNIWSVKKFMELPLQSIEAIRTSQFSNDPEAVTRVVLDIGKPIDFRSFQEGNDIIVKLPAVAEETDFAAWSVTGAKPIEPIVQKVAPRPAEEVKIEAKQKVAGVEIESYPERKVVAYNSSDYRDPFDPLVGGPGGQLAGELPALENLVLVGILSDIDGNRALLEDAEGNGYIMMPKDRVKNGYLVSVGDNKAIFQITEYGWTRTVALELEVVEIK